MLVLVPQAQSVLKVSTLEAVSEGNPISMEDVETSDGDIKTAVVDSLETKESKRHHNMNAAVFEDAIQKRLRAACMW